MILKGSQRGGGQDLAVHLLRIDENDHVRLHELRGFAGETLKEAFKETEAISKGTRCQQYLFSLSLSPPEDARVSVDIFEDAIARIEERLGLEDQPRAIVFHEKEGRRHAHCVWSRIDADTMTARHMSFFKTKLAGISRDLYLENGWKIPRGLENAGERNPTNFTLAEWQQAKREGMDPRWLKATLQGCWNRSDSRKALQASFEERGFQLAQGDRRGFVVIDHNGEAYSLPRMLDLKTKEVRARLGDPADLPGVAACQKIVAQRMTPAIRRHIAESRQKFQERSATLGTYKAEMTQHHRDARRALDRQQQQAWDDENRVRAARLPKGLRGLWHRLTGRYQQVRAINQSEASSTRQRQAVERERLFDHQREQRRVLQEQYKKLRGEQARALLDLRKDIGRFLKFARGDDPARGQEASSGLQLSR